MEESGNKITIENVKKIVWEILNFPSHANQMEAIKSPKFEIVGPNGDKTKWFMEIYPNGFYYHEYVALHVNLSDFENAKEKTARIEMAILDSNGEEKQKKTAIYAGRNWQFPKLTSRLECPELIKRDLLLNEENGLLTNGKLTIVCRIDIIGRVESPMDNIQIPIPPCQLSADFANLLEGGILTDLVLISSDNKEYKAHKNVLACRSPVFAAMFQDGMTETKTNSVKIEGIRGDVLQQMLHFIYTGNAPNIGALGRELLAAADKYQIGRLKMFCERSLALSLDIGNACDLLVLADLHSADHLKPEVIQFIALHADEVIKSDGWQILSNGHSRLLAQLFEEAMASRKSRNL